MKQWFLSEIRKKMNIIPSMYIQTVTKSPEKTSKATLSATFTVDAMQYYKTSCLKVPDKMCKTFHK